MCISLLKQIDVLTDQNHMSQIIILLLLPYHRKRSKSSFLWFWVKICAVVFWWLTCSLAFSVSNGLKLSSVHRHIKNILPSSTQNSSDCDCVQFKIVQMWMAAVDDGKNQEVVYLNLIHIISISNLLTLLRKKQIIKVCLQGVAEYHRPSCAQ